MKSVMEASFVLLHLCVVQLEEGVVVVGVVIHPLVQHCHVAVDLLAALVQGPVLATLPATALFSPAAQTHTHTHMRAHRHSVSHVKELIW